MVENKQKKRRVGRPKEGSGDAAREALIKAGAELFSYHGFAATKISELARAANVTPAMVHYYFGGKDKLAEAVLEEAFAPLMRQIQEIETLDDWVAAFHGQLLKHRWLPHFIRREVMTGEGQLTTVFQQRYLSNLLPKWIMLLQREKEEGRVREDVNEMRHAMFMIAMLVHPFMVSRIKSSLFPLEFTDAELIEFRNDALALFRNGTAPKT